MTAHSVTTRVPAAALLGTSGRLLAQGQRLALAHLPAEEQQPAVQRLLAVEFRLPEALQLVLLCWDSGCLLQQSGDGAWQRWPAHAALFGMS